MSEMSFDRCVLVPCSSERSWVVPQRCLGEILTIPSAEELPPAEVLWRGEEIPVVDFGRDDPLPWRDQLTGAGLIAIVLGQQRDQACQYFGVAVRGGALGVCQFAQNDIEDLPGVETEYASATFRVNGNIYQVPDLLALQRTISAGNAII